MHEDPDITNDSQKPVKFQLEIALRCDFADIFEVKSGSIVRRGRITTDWSEPQQHLRTTYRNGDFIRVVTISPARSSAKAVYANGRLSFEVALEPGGHGIAASTGCCYTSSVGNAGGLATKGGQDRDQQRGILSPVSPGTRGMAALRLPIAGTDHLVFLPAAGLPGSSPHSDATA